MDISETLAPNSDQLDAIELVAGPRTFTIREVTPGNAEQPVNVHLEGFPRPWRPGKSMRRVLAACWGTDASKYVGRRVTLFCDPEVVFGKEKVGGTRIRALSDIDGPQRVPLLVSRGKSATYVVQPLAAEVPKRDEGVTDAQLKAIGGGLDRLGVSSREEKGTTVERIILREIGSAKDLTRAEADAVLAWIAEADR